MKTIKVYDPGLCCNTGVCGVDVDQLLVDFAADMDWFTQQGGKIERFNLAQQPMAFAENPVVKSFLEARGQDGLPLVLVDNEQVISGRYPSRDELLDLSGIEIDPAAAPGESSETAVETTCCGGSSRQSEAPDKAASSSGCCGGSKTKAESGSGCCG